MTLPNKATISTYNGFGKIDSAVGPTNPLTDWSNPALGGAVSDIAALGQTAPSFICRITLAASTSALTLNNWYAQWMNVTNTLPVLTRTSTGVFTVQLPSLVSSEYSASVGVTNNITVNLFAASASLEGTTFGFINASASGNLITIHTANSSASANDLVGTTIFCAAY